MSLNISRIFVVVFFVCIYNTFLLFFLVVFSVFNNYLFINIPFHFKSSSSSSPSKSSASFSQSSFWLASSLFDDVPTISNSCNSLSNSFSHCSSVKVFVLFFFLLVFCFFIYMQVFFFIYLINFIFVLMIDLNFSLFCFIFFYSRNARSEAFLFWIFVALFFRAIFNI